MPVCNIVTGEKLFDLIDKSLSDRHIPWTNVVGFESDTANVMIERHNSVLSCVKAKQPNVFSQGFTCHLASLCLLKGVQAVPVISSLIYSTTLTKVPSTRRSYKNSESLLALSGLSIVRPDGSAWRKLYSAHFNSRQLCMLTLTGSLEVITQPEFQALQELSDKASLVFPGICTGFNV